MAGSADDRIAALQAAIDDEDWGAFADEVRGWAADDPSDPRARLGVAVAGAITGDIPGAGAEIADFDVRLGNLAALLDDVRAGNRAKAQGKIVAEMSYGTREPVFLDAYRWAEPSLVDPTRHLFATPHLVAGCILEGGQVASMASRGSRMSADSLGHRADQIWADVVRLNNRIAIGAVTSIRVYGGDGSWVLSATGEQKTQIVTVLVAASTVAGEAAARAEAVAMSLEDEQ